MNLKRLIVELAVGHVIPTPNGSVIFIYHDISETKAIQYSPYYSTTPSAFKKQIAFIQSKYIVVPLEELLAKNLSEKNYAAITFDDGFASVYSIAFPFLRSKGIPFTIFLNKTAVQSNQLWVSNLFIKRHNPEYLNKFFYCHDFEGLEKNDFLDNPVDFVKKHFENIDLSMLMLLDVKFPNVYMGEDDVKYLHRHGVRVGNHTENHIVLSKVSKEVQQKEILNNKEFLEDLVNQKIEFLAVPFGKKNDFNGDTINLANVTGHTHVFSSNPSLIDNSEAVIPRIGLVNDPVRTLKFYLKRSFFKKIDI